MKKEIIAFNKIGLVLCLVFLSLFLHVSSADAVLRTVPDQYSTIQNALAASTAGDIVYVKPGTYTGTIAMVESVDLIGTDKETVIIDGYITGASNTAFENFKVAPTTAPPTAGTSLYKCNSGATNVKIKDCIFLVTTTASANLSGGIYLPSVISGEITNNSIKIKSTAAGVTIKGIDITGTSSGVVCTNNSLSLEVTSATSTVKGVEYAGTGHTIKNNGVKTKATDLTKAIAVTAVTGTDPLDINYNLLLGNVEGSVGALIGNLLGIDPVFVVGDLLKLQNISPAVGAADPTYPLYAMGVTDIGIYDSSVIKKDIKEIQKKIDAANAGDTVLIEPGVYTPVWPSYVFSHCNGKRRIWSTDLIINKNLTLKAIDPNPAHTVIDLNGSTSHGISIMATNYYYGNHQYSYTGFNTVDDVTIEGITLKGRCRGSEEITVWVREYGYGKTGYWAHFTSANVKSPIYNFSKNLTLKNCDIQSTNYINLSIYTWLGTTLNLVNTAVAEERIKRESNTRFSYFRCPY